MNTRPPTNPPGSIPGSIITWDADIARHRLMAAIDLSCTMGYTVAEQASQFRVYEHEIARMRRAGIDPDRLTAHYDETVAMMATLRAPFCICPSHVHR